MNTKKLKTETIPVDKIQYSSDKYNKFPHLIEQQKRSSLFQNIFKSIEKEGLKNPLIVEPKGHNGKYKLYIGNNRLTSVKMLNQTEVECIIGQFTKEQIKNIKTTTYTTTSSDT